MSDIEVLGVGLVVIIYVAGVVFGIFLAIAPLFCWIHLRKIRRQQVENMQRVDAHLCAMRRSLEKIDDALRHVCSMLEARKQA